MTETTADSAGPRAVDRGSSTWTYSSALQSLTDVKAGALAPTEWSTVRVGALEARYVGKPAVPEVDVRLVSGRVVVLRGHPYGALQAILGWNIAAGRQAQFPRDSWVLAATPSGHQFLGVRWVNAIIEAGDVTYERYQIVRAAHDAEIAAGRTPRSAWERALATLRTGTSAGTGREATQQRSATVPPELELAWTNLGFRLDLAPATANHYRSMLRRVFERLDGALPTDELHLERVLRTVSERWSYCAAVRTAWRALAKAAAVDGIQLLLPSAAGVTT